MRKNIDITKNPTSEQVATLTKATTFPIRAEDEYPEFSEAELLQFKKFLTKEKQIDKNRLSHFACPHKH